MIIELDGKKIRNENEFHEAISIALNFSQFYGRNLSALSDVLGTDVERPLQLIWNDSQESKRSMGARYDDVLRVLRSVEQEDVEIGYPARFEVLLR
jgi:ribonuclease inhibitor